MTLFCPCSSHQSSQQGFLVSANSSCPSYLCQIQSPHRNALISMGSISKQGCIKKLSRATQRRPGECELAWEMAPASLVQYLEQHPDHYALGPQSIQFAGLTDSFLEQDDIPDQVTALSLGEENWFMLWRSVVGRTQGTLKRCSRKRCLAAGKRTTSATVQQNPAAIKVRLIHIDNYCVGCKKFQKYMAYPCLYDSSSSLQNQPNGFRGG